MQDSLLSLSFSIADCFAFDPEDWVGLTRSREPVGLASKKGGRSDASKVNVSSLPSPQATKTRSELTSPPIRIS